mmetsp:Transcript_40250/g.116361  ORF Transcript_40250/g.116361 Transcript_40250/m.116361 type:complete len:126 (-) Transcript_40250:55-432(-)
MKFTMYHGTTADRARSINANGFQRSKDGMLGAGVYLTRDINKARGYGDGTIITVSVAVGKVKKIDRQGHPLQKSWHNHGYDSAWVPPDSGMVLSGLTETCIYDPSRIHIVGIKYGSGKKDDCTVM